MKPTKPSSSRCVKPVMAAVLPAMLVLACGCSMLSYTGPSGERFSRFNFGTKTAIAGLAVDTDTNGIRRFQLQGYQTDATQALGTVTEAAVRAALGARP